MHIRSFLLALIILTGFTAQLLAHEGTATHLDYINHAIADAPNNQALYIKRGTLYSEEAGLHARALQDFRHAETLGPPILVAYEFALMFYRQGEFVQARQHLDRYINAFPQLAQPYEARAKTLAELGEINAALTDYSRYFALQSNIHPGSFITAAKMHAAQQTQAGINAAIALLDQGLNTLGLNPQLQRYAIELELQRGQPDNAVERLTTLKALLKASPAWQIEMAELLLRTEQVTQAQMLLTQAETQLASLKQTPARLTLRQKIQHLQVQANAIK